MYLTAHHVHREGVEQINAFLHLHGRDFVWPPDPERLPDEEPGEVVAKLTPLTPGGNLVRSYLDLLAPDDTPESELRDAVRHLQDDLLERRNPTLFRHLRVTIRFGVELGLAGIRKHELTALATTAFGLFARKERGR